MNALHLNILGSGSKGNCTALVCGEAVLLIDAGFSAKELQRRLESVDLCMSRVAGLVLSHEHSDHVQGARVLAKRHPHFPVFSNSLTAEKLHFGGKAPQNLSLFTNGSMFKVGPFQVTPFSVCHDAADPVMFAVDCAGKRVVIATDLGYAGKMVTRMLRDAHALILESNHDPGMVRRSNRPVNLQHRILGRRGHLSNEAAARLLPAILSPCTQTLVLAHLSEECNTPELAQKSAGDALRELGREDVTLITAEQHTPMPRICL